MFVTKMKLKIQNPARGEIFYGLSENFLLIIDEPDLKKLIKRKSSRLLKKDKIIF
ncbi:hypothetical protein BMS3Abin03_02894 [bacterium BMS3Abin03]|nr:hypothetical protein BMS3Abin03_02894 [bacterium BMS3Abin03]